MRGQWEVRQDLHTIINFTTHIYCFDDLTDYACSHHSCLTTIITEGCTSEILSIQSFQGNNEQLRYEDIVIFNKKPPSFVVGKSSLELSFQLCGYEE